MMHPCLTPKMLKTRKIVASRKVTEEAVIAILARSMTFEEIKAKFDLSRQTIANIRNGTVAMHIRPDLRRYDVSKPKRVKIRTLPKD